MSLFTKYSFSRFEILFKISTLLLLELALPEAKDLLSWGLDVATRNLNSSSSF